MKSKLFILSLALLSLVVRAEVPAVEAPQDEREIDFEAAVVAAAATKRLTNKDCLRVRKNFRVCGDSIFDGDVAIGGDLAVAGTIRATSIITTNSTITGGDLAYGAAAWIDASGQTVAAGAAVPFNIVNFPSSGVTSAIDGSITVGSAGIYRIEAQVEGTNMNDGALPIAFQFWVNDNESSLGQFESETPVTYTISAGAQTLTAAGGVRVAHGFGIISLQANDVITIVNQSAPDGLGSVALLTSPDGSAAVTVTVERIA